MRKTAYLTAALVCGMFLVSCDKPKNSTAGQPASEQGNVHATDNTDTLLVITMPDSALWGHLGEGTGMSVLEFVTDAGDTLYINKESETSGNPGIIYGSIRNYTDRFCITTTDDGNALLKAVNVTEMQELWSENAHWEK